jgi:hypothetical protein
MTADVMDERSGRNTTLLVRRARLNIYTGSRVKPSLFQTLSMPVLSSFEYVEDLFVDCTAFDIVRRIWSAHGPSGTSLPFSFRHCLSLAAQVLRGEVLFCRYSSRMHGHTGDAMRKYIEVEELQPY